MTRSSSPQIIRKLSDSLPKSELAFGLVSGTPSTIRPITHHSTITHPRPTLHLPHDHFSHQSRVGNLRLPSFHPNLRPLTSDFNLLISNFNPPRITATLLQYCPRRRRSFTSFPIRISTLLRGAPSSTRLALNWLPSISRAHQFLSFLLSLPVSFPPNLSSHFTFHPPPISLSSFPGPHPFLKLDRPFFVRLRLSFQILSARSQSFLSRTQKKKKTRPKTKTRPTDCKSSLPKWHSKWPSRARTRSTPNPPTHPLAATTRTIMKVPRIPDLPHSRPMRIQRARPSSPSHLASMPQSHCQFDSRQHMAMDTTRAPFWRIKTPLPRPAPPVNLGRSCQPPLQPFIRSRLL